MYSRKVLVISSNSFQIRDRRRILKNKLVINLLLSQMNYEGKKKN